MNANADNFAEKNCVRASISFGRTLHSSYWFGSRKPQPSVQAGINSPGSVRQLSFFRTDPVTFPFTRKSLPLLAILAVFSFAPSTNAVANSRTEKLKKHLSQPGEVSAYFKKVIRNRPKIVIADEEVEISNRWTYHHMAFSGKSFYYRSLGSFESQELASPKEAAVFMSGVFGNYCWRVSDGLFYRFDFPDPNAPLSSLLRIENDHKNPVTIPCYSSLAIIAQTLNLGLDAIEVGSFTWNGIKFVAQGFDGNQVTGEIALDGSGAPKELIMSRDGFPKGTFFVSELYYAMGGGNAGTPGTELPIRFDQFWLVNGNRQLIQEIEIAESPDGGRWNTVVSESINPSQLFAERKFRELYYKDGKLTEFLAGGFHTDHSNLLFAVGGPVEHSISSPQRISLVAILALITSPAVFWYFRRRAGQKRNKTT